LADPQLTTLLDFQFRHIFRAERGGHGGNYGMTGARGADYVVRLPVGTVVYDAGTGDQLRDMVLPTDTVVIARGGRAGLGNMSAPTATEGYPGRERRLRLELKLIADVGLIGIPNAGKSSLLARISTAKPKIANYPFTTISPVLGVVQLGPQRTFVACDIPGLIEGAHEGKGLGIQFLRHIERTRLLVHVVDMAGVDGQLPWDAFESVTRELAAYSPVLADRPQVVAANKMDLPEAAERLAEFRPRVELPIYPISCATGHGTRELLEAVWTRLQALPAAAPAA
jgi:GTP-binding protein